MPTSNFASKATHNPDSPLHPSAMTLTASEPSTKSSIVLIGPSEELPNFMNIVRYIQNRVSWCIGSESTEARLFCKFFGMSVTVLEILWELVLCNKL